MKGIIFNTDQEAIGAVDYCTKNIVENDVQFINSSVQPADTPYTEYLTHSTNGKYAVIANQKVEECLHYSAVELDSSWFPETFTR
jgi:hypothetical protein